MKLQGLIVFKYCTGKQEKWSEASIFFLENAHFIKIYIFKYNFYDMYIYKKKHKLVYVIL